LIGWAPIASRPPPKGEVKVQAGKGPDADGDGSPDEVDACPAIAGEPDANPTLDGCPRREVVGAPKPGDRDGDGVADKLDACPALAGVASPEPTVHGCPSDRDGDGIADDEDQCPYDPWPLKKGAHRRGCPP
jgi:hypothetical protein